jgi:hypothetical protein
MIVTFEETGETREVKGLCLVCFPYPHVMGGDDYEIVSPQGLAHAGGEFGITDCGKDATRTNWWWRL